MPKEKWDLLIKLTTFCAATMMTISFIDKIDKMLIINIIY